MMRIVALIALGSSAAYFYSVALLLFGIAGHVYFETAALIITLILVGKYLEVRAKSQTSAAIKTLMGLQAKTARVVRGGAEQDVPVGEVRKGEIAAIADGITLVPAPGWNLASGALLGRTRTPVGGTATTQLVDGSVRFDVQAAPFDGTPSALLGRITASAVRSSTLKSSQSDQFSM